MDRCHTAPGGKAESGFSSPQLVLPSRFRDVAPDKIHGGVLENPGRFAGDGIFKDLAARGRRRSSVDPGYPQSEAVDQGHVNIVTVDEDRMFPGNGVHPFPPRKLGSGEALVIPISVENPVPYAKLGGLRSDASGEFPAGRSVAEIQTVERKTAAEKMGVAVDETGKDRSFSRVEDPRPGPASARISASVPIARILAPLTATAEARLPEGSPTITFPLTTTISAAADDFMDGLFMVMLTPWTRFKNSPLSGVQALVPT